MDRRKKKRLTVWALALAFALYSAQPAAAMILHAPRPEPGQETAGERVYEVSLDVVTVAAGEERSYLTVDPAMADNPLAQDYYPGELTVEFTGQVTVAAGGVLSIGKLAVGGPEPSPVLRGELSPEGMIRVEAGGILWLNGVTLELSGGGLAIVQEPGAIVEIYNTPLEEELCRWGGAMADNRYAAPVEVALVQGETLKEGSLPKEGRVWLNEKGRSKYCRLPMEWDISSCERQTEGEATVSGTYLDEDGLPLPALLPVEAHLRWYTPEEIVLTEKSWMGNTAAEARLGYQALPEEAAEIWGELSQDGGKSWERWERCYFDESNGHLTCTFVLSDATPRQYRLAAADWEGSRGWRSEAVTLPEESDPDDSGGNRGGSTDPVPPSREPEPVDDRSDDDGEAEPAPKPSPAPGGVETTVPQPSPPSEIAPSPAPERTELPEVTFTPEPPPPLAPEPVAPVVEPVPTEAADPPPPAPATVKPAQTDAPAHSPAVTAVPAPSPSIGPSPTSGVSSAPRKQAETPAPAVEPVPTETAAPAEEHEAPGALPSALQAALAAVGLGVCAAVGAAVARGGPFRKKK